jgi:TolB-like protein
VGPPSIAVLPFVDMSEEHDQQYLGDGIAEELLNALASIEGLNVAARTSSFSFGGKGASIREIGDTLHVRHVLEGSVRRSGEKLRVTAQLIDVETGFHLFSRSYDREAKDIFDVQNEIAREIVAALMPKLGLGNEASLVRQGTSNLEAYNLWLKAHAALSMPSPATLRPAIQLLEQAIALDPKFGNAWGDLAYANAYLGIWDPEPVPYAFDAEVAAALALEYSPANVPALLTRAAVRLVVHRDVAAMESYVERARKAGGERSLWAYQYAYLVGGPLGRYEEAIAVLQEAAKNDPLAPNLKWALIEMYLPLGRVDEAVAAADVLRQQGVKAPGSFVLVGLAYLAAANVEAARETLDSATVTLGEDFPVTLLLQFAIFDATGDREGARRLLDRLEAMNGDGRTVHPYVMGEGYKVVGDYDRTLEYWTRAVDQYRLYAFNFMPARNRNHPVIGKDPRFLALLKRMGLEVNRAARLPEPEVGR